MYAKVYTASKQNILSEEKMKQNKKINRGLFFFSLLMVFFTIFTGCRSGSPGLRNQAILSINDPGVKTFGDPPFTISTRGGNGSGIVSYSFTGEAVSISGNTVTILGAGSSVITATKAADSTLIRLFPPR